MPRITFATGFLLIACPAFASAHAPEELLIRMTADGFVPAEIEAHTGETITFVNEDAREHWPASNLHPTHTAYPGSSIEKCGTEEAPRVFDACRGVLPGETYSFVFETPGTWKYHDHLAAEMSGTITVTGESGSAEPAAESNFSLGAWLAGIWDGIARWFERLYYALRPSALDAALAGVSLLEAAREDGAALERWLSLIGTKEYMERMREEAESAGVDCHTPAHVIGRASYEMFGNRSFQTCNAECHSGCYHGATEAYFAKNGTGDLNDSLDTICSFSDNSFFTHQCVHGIGHGLMAWESYELPKALADCDLLSEGQSSCYTGVFMENIVGGLGGETGHVSAYLSDDPHFPCSIVDERYKSSCYFLQTSRIIQLYPGDFAKVGSVCAAAPSDDTRLLCFESMGRDVGGSFRGNPAGAIAACAMAPGAGRDQCLHGVVQDLLWDPTQADAALTFCKALTTVADKSMCYDSLSIRATQVFSSANAADDFCERFETPYAGACSS